jgi:hypothetical protein
VIKFVSNFRQVGGFLRFPSPINLTATIFFSEILLKVADDIAVKLLECTSVSGVEYLCVF